MAAGDVPPRAPRVPVVSLVQCRWNLLGDLTPEYASDLSASGVFLHAEEAHPPGTPVHLRITLRDGSTIEAFGRVARVGRDAAGISGLAVRFDALDEASRAALEAAVGPG